MLSDVQLAVALKVSNYMRASLIDAGILPNRMKPMGE